MNKYVDFWSVRGVKAVKAFDDDYDDNDILTEILGVEEIKREGVLELNYSIVTNQLFIKQGRTYNR